MMRKSDVLRFVIGGMLVCSHSAMAQVTSDDAEQISRSRADSMALQQLRYYFVESPHGLAQLDQKISQRLGQSSSSHYHVVYFMPQRDRDIYQALVTEYAAQ